MLCQGAESSFAVDIVRASEDGTGSASSERVGFLREGGSAGAEKVIYAFLSGSTRAGESGKLMVQRTT